MQPFVLVAERYQEHNHCGQKNTILYLYEPWRKMSSFVGGCTRENARKILPTLEMTGGGGRSRHTVNVREFECQMECKIDESGYFRKIAT